MRPTTKEIVAGAVAMAATDRGLLLSAEDCLHIAGRAITVIRGLQLDAWMTLTDEY